MNTISHNLQALLNKIRETEKRYGRKPQSVTLVAVSKAHPIEDIQEAYQGGQHHFGENYLQEALPKIEAARQSNLHLTWHFIGQIQTNKIKHIAQHFTWIHSLDSEKAAKKLNTYSENFLKDVCIEVNLNENPKQGGVLLKELKTLALFITSLPNLHLRGLMTIAPPFPSFDQQRKYFEQCRKVFESLKTDLPSLDTLSMGMSNDFEAAIAEGSTMVRIGTAIFGPRSPQNKYSSLTNSGPDHSPGEI